MISYFKSADSFNIFCYIIFGITQFFMALAIYKALEIRSQILKKEYTRQYSFICQLLHTLSLFSSKILLQLSSLCLGYIIRSTFTHEEIAAYKGYSAGLYKENAGSYISFALITLSFAQQLTATVLHIFFCQDRGLYKATIWACNNWYAELAMSGIQIITQMSYTVSGDQNGLIELANALCWLGLVILMIWYVQWIYTWVGFAEFFCGTLLLFIYVFIVLCGVIFLLPSFTSL